MKKFQVGKWYFIEWLDAYSGDDVEWHDDKETWAKDLPILTAGYCIKITKNYVHLTQNWERKEKSYFHITSVPFGMIRKIRCIR